MNNIYIYIHFMQIQLSLKLKNCAAVRNWRQNFKLLSICSVLWFTTAPFRYLINILVFFLAENWLFSTIFSLSKWIENLYSSANDRNCQNLAFYFSSVSLRSYRVSHETWQLMNSFECLLPYTVLNIKTYRCLIR